QWRTQPRFLRTADKVERSRGRVLQRLRGLRPGVSGRLLVAWLMKLVPSTMAARSEPLCRLSAGIEPSQIRAGLGSDRGRGGAVGDTEAKNVVKRAQNMMLHQARGGNSIARCNKLGEAAVFFDR